MKDTLLITNGIELLAVYQGSTQILGDEGSITALLSDTAAVEQPWRHTGRPESSFRAEPTIRHERPPEREGPETERSRPHIRSEAYGRQ